MAGLSGDRSPWKQSSKTPSAAARTEGIGSAATDFCRSRVPVPPTSSPPYYYGDDYYYYYYYDDYYYYYYYKIT